MGLRFKAILFDMDGVIIDSMPYHYKAWQAVFNSLGIELNELEVYKREGEQGIVSLSELLVSHGRELDFEQRLVLLREKEALFKEIALPELFPGVESLIRDLKGKGILLGLVTGTSRKELEHILPRPLLDAFDIVVTGDEVKRGKPDPEPYLKAIEGLKIDPEESVVIENAPYGIESAKRAGAFCIAVTTSLPRRFIAAADIICDSLKEVRALLFDAGDAIKIEKRN